MATLERIRTKVRRLTRSPSANQITDDQIDQYIDDFVLYDFPSHIRPFSLRENFLWYSVPNIDTYTTDDQSYAVDLQNFKNTEINTYQPIYIAGRPAYFSQDQTEFFAQFPEEQSITTLATGDGVTTDYAGTLTDKPILQDQVTISTIDTGGNVVTVTDTPTSRTQGNLLTLAGSNLGTIDYITGEYDISFIVPPASGEKITIATVPYTAGRPTSILYFDNTFVLKPVPDGVYHILMEVHSSPSQLINNTDSPEIEQWWQYIAYGAAKKIFEDRTDLDSVAQIMPEFKQQEILVLRKTIDQQSSQRASTIYEHQTGLSAAPWRYDNGNF
jgi:hypothetical protein